MKADYFSDLLPASVTHVTQAKNDCVTPETDSATHKNSELAEVSRLSRMSRAEMDNTEHDEWIREQLEERAAIMEYDGGLPREQAVTEARKALRIFKYRITDTPKTWLFLIAPGCDLEEARRSLQRRFGERLVDVQTYQPRGAV